MLLTLTLLAALLGQGTPPAQATPADTMRLVRGFANQQYAWGTMRLRKGEQVRAYLPVAGTVADVMIPYYLQSPDSGPKVKPKFTAIANVQWLRVRGQYFEVLSSGKREEGRLAARMQSGAVDLFAARFVPPPILTALGPNPVLSAPVDASHPGPDAASMSWYLRRPNGPPVLVSPANFATQVATFLADDRELARRVAASEAGYRLAELESIIQQYNQRARR
jgi:hypothetical protein